MVGCNSTQAAEVLAQPSATWEQCDCKQRFQPFMQVMAVECVATLRSDFHVGVLTVKSGRIVAVYLYSFAA
jgi:hypothetical protein